MLLVADRRRERCGREDLAREVHTPRNSPGRGRRRRLGARRLRGRQRRQRRQRLWRRIRFRIWRRWVRRERRRRRLYQVRWLERDAGFGWAGHRQSLRGGPGIGCRVQGLGATGGARPPRQRRFRGLLGGLHAPGLHRGLQERRTRLSLPRLRLRPGERGSGGDRPSPTPAPGVGGQGPRRGGGSRLAALKPSAFQLPSFLLGGEALAVGRCYPRLRLPHEARITRIPCEALAELLTSRLLQAARRHGPNKLTISRLANKLTSRRLTS